MKKFITMSFFLLLSNLHVAQAGIIEIPEEYYFSDNINGIDWVWVSAVNQQGYSGGSEFGWIVDNTICSPTETVVFDVLENKNVCQNNVDSTWRYAEAGELSLLEDLTYKNNFFNDLAQTDPIHAAQYWNTELQGIGGADINDFQNNHFASYFNSGSMALETFYVRTHEEESGEPVPEPNVLMLMLIAVGLLWSRRKAIKG